MIERAGRTGRPFLLVGWVELLRYPSLGGAIGAESDGFREGLNPSYK
jgi:hypothetical protein